MRTSRIAQAPRSARGWMWLWLFCLLALLLGCGGSSYAKAAHEAPSSPRAGYRGETVVASAESANYAPGDEGGYDYEFEGDFAAEAMAMPASEPMPALEPDSANLAEDRPVRTAQRSEPAKAKPAEAPAAPPPGDPHGTKPDEPAVASDAVPIKQVLIYTAQIRMAVFEVEQALDDVEALARSLGGFLSRRTDNEITIRVPAAQFDDAMKGVASQGDVLTRNVQVEDVTEEYLDVMLRLKNARQVRERIAQLLANAKNVEESLKVERELNRLSAQIERLEGRLKYLRNRAQYSTITVTFQPQRSDDVPKSAFQLPFPWLRELGLGRLMNLR